MDFKQRLIPGFLLKRYKRFLADVEIDGCFETVHCPNPGSMIGLNAPRSRVWLSRSENVKRRLQYTLELVEAQVGGEEPTLVGVNAAFANRIVEEAIRKGAIARLSEYGTLRREVRYGANSRIDLLLEQDHKPPCYVEVKNVHLCRTPRLAEFPDCVTARGAKHLRELSSIAKSGARAVLFLCVQRSDCSTFAVASDLDPVYAKAFSEALASGVETLIHSCHISPVGISLSKPVEFCPKDSLGAHML